MKARNVWGGFGFGLVALGLLRAAAPGEANAGGPRAMFVRVETDAGACYQKADGGLVCAEDAGMPAATDATPLIELSRGPCSGDCPVYTVKIFADGRTEFAGTKFVKAKGPFKAKLKPAQIAELKDLITGLGKEKDLECKKDFPLVTTRFVQDGQVRTLKHREECGKGTPALEEAELRIRTLEGRIDELTGSGAWINEDAPP